VSPWSTACNSVELGSVVPLDASLLAGPERWLQVSVNGEVMTPRERFDSQ
jgi:hypothetical protein